MRSKATPSRSRHRVRMKPLRDHWHCGRERVREREDRYATDLREEMLREFAFVFEGVVFDVSGVHFAAADGLKALFCERARVE
jgi:hypothetical protein